MGLALRGITCGTIPRSSVSRTARQKAESRANPGWFTAVRNQRDPHPRQSHDANSTTLDGPRRSLDSCPCQLFGSASCAAIELGFGSFGVIRQFRFAIRLAVPIGRIRTTNDNILHAEEAI